MNPVVADKSTRFQACQPCQNHAECHGHYAGELYNKNDDGYDSDATGEPGEDASSNANTDADDANDDDDCG